MPTAYTHKVMEGSCESFSEFALLCARNFGACVSMRDDPLSKDIPEFEPSTYHKVELERSLKELEVLESSTPEDIEHLYKDYVKKELDYYKRASKEHINTRIRYEQMLLKVRLWNVPTQDHENLKKFMIEQLESSIKYDCYEVTLDINSNMTTWFNDKLRQASDKVVYHEKHWVEEQSRVSTRNQWIKDLKDSL